MKIQIKNRFTQSILFECDAPDGMESGMHTRYALENASNANADLRDAYLSDADLRDAYLRGGEKLVGNRPVFQIGPIGSRCDYFVSYITDCGLRFDAGCQRQITRENLKSDLLICMVKTSMQKNTAPHLP